MMESIASQQSVPASAAAPPTSFHLAPYFAHAQSCSHSLSACWHADEPTSNKAVLIKTALDQLVWGPVMTLVFFAFLKTLEGRPDLILHTVSCSDVLMVGRARGQR